MRSNNKFAKATRRKGAIERLEKNIADYVTLMKETKDKDTLKKYEQKICDFGWNITVCSAFFEKICAEPFSADT